MNGESIADECVGLRFIAALRIRVGFGIGCKWVFNWMVLHVYGMDRSIKYVQKIGFLGHVQSNDPRCKESLKQNLP